MNLSKLKVGMIIKNYKEMCETLEEKVKTSNSKKSQINNWMNYFRWERKGNSYIVKEIYEDIKPIVKKTRPLKDYESFNINDEKMYEKGVYCIILGNKIYIGSTVENFRYRFQNHISISNKLITRQMLLDGAKYSVLWVAEDTDIEDVVRDKELEFINKYRSDINWIVVNSFRHNPYVKGNGGNKFKIKKIISDYKKIYISKKDIEKVIQYMEDNNINYKEKQNELIKT